MIQLKDFEKRWTVSHEKLSVSISEWECWLSENPKKCYQIWCMSTFEVMFLGNYRLDFADRNFHRKLLICSGRFSKKKFSVNFASEFQWPGFSKKNSMNFDITPYSNSTLYVLTGSNFPIELSMKLLTLVEVNLVGKPLFQNICKREIVPRISSFGTWFKFLIVWRWFQKVPPIPNLIEQSIFKLLLLDIERLDWIHAME